MPGWRAHLVLGFAERRGKTLPVRRSHQGPLRVQRPFYPESDGSCHMYLLHPPGGVVGGDRLDVHVSMASGSAVLTTPAANKFYRSEGVLAEQAQHLTVGGGAALEWLPQETIVFSGAAVRAQTRVDLGTGARFIGWDVTCLGRPGAGERFDRGCYTQRWDIRRAGRVLWWERGEYPGGGASLSAPWGLQAQPVFGTLVAVHKDPALISALRDALPCSGNGGRFVVSQLDEVLLCRYLGPHAAEAMARFATAWEILRPAVLGKAACRPRIWAT
ncbi:MAG TPA: urease accessory protein [Gammaproteobacteria bacterium]|nr:urease accessory protein [Gammaproteobacteria bacterium]